MPDSPLTDSKKTEWATYRQQLRDIPNNTVIRPCDTLETAIAWKYAIENNAGPTCLVLSRQNCQFQDRSSEQIALINKGAYILKDPKGLKDFKDCKISIISKLFKKYNKLP